MATYICCYIFFYGGITLVYERLVALRLANVIFRNHAIWWWLLVQPCWFVFFITAIHAWASLVWIGVANKLLGLRFDLRFKFYQLLRMDFSLYRAFLCNAYTPLFFHILLLSRHLLAILKNYFLQFPLQIVLNAMKLLHNKMMLLLLCELWSSVSFKFSLSMIYLCHWFCS